MSLMDFACICDLHSGSVCRKRSMESNDQIVSFKQRSGQCYLVCIAEQVFLKDALRKSCNESRVQKLFFCAKFRKPYEHRTLWFTVGTLGPTNGVFRGIPPSLSGSQPTLLKDQTQKLMTEIMHQFIGSQVV